MSAPKQMKLNAFIHAFRIAVMPLCNVFLMPEGERALAFEAADARLKQAAGLTPLRADDH